MTVVVGTPVTGTTPSVTVTVPALVTTGMAALIVFATATSTDWDPVPAKSGATFTLIDDRAAGNLRVTIWTGTGLVAGDVITTSATVNSGCTIWHSYRDDYTYNVASVSAAIRGGSTAVSLTGSLTPAAAQQVAVVGVERTTATPTTVSSVVSNGGETVTQQSYNEQTAGVAVSVYTGDFTASAAASRTVTITYSDASANGYGALLTMTAVVPPVVAAVWPAAPQDLAVDLYLNGAWVPIKSYVRRDPGVTITRGRPDEAAAPNPAAARMAVNNRDGRFSPRLPTGAYYGLIGRNTPLRVSLPAATSWLSVDTQTTRSASPAAIGVSTPDSADLKIVGDIDIRFDADLDTWREPALLVSKWTETGNQRSYSLELTSEPGTGVFAGTMAGCLRLRTSSTGAAAGVVQADSTLRVPVQDGRLAVRATLDVDNGAAGKTWTFYTSTGGVNGTWTQLGDPVTTAGTTSIFSSTAIGYILNNPDNTGSAGTTYTGGVIRGRIYMVQIHNGIAGTVRANPNFAIQTAGATSFVDTSLTTPKTWTLVGAVSLVNRNLRFSGQVPAWNVGADTSGTDIWTDIEASGKLRQLGQGVAPIAATMENLALKVNATKVVAYWACTDADGATRFASGLSGEAPIRINGTPTLASYTGNIRSSSALPVLANSIWTGVVSPYTPTTSTPVWFLLVLPTGGEANNTVLFRIRGSGDIYQTDIIYTSASGGGLKFISYDSTGAALWTGTALTGLNGLELIVYTVFTVSGGQTQVKFHVMNLADSALQQDNSSLFSTSIGSVTKIGVNPGGAAVNTAIGQITVTNNGLELFQNADVQGAARAWIGEAAGRRVERLCDENGIDFKGVGDLTYTSAMGAQLPDTLMGLLTSCVEADLGILFEPREILGLGYRTRTSLYDQPARLALDYAQAQMDSLDPVEDDQLLRNDVTVTRTEGSGARVTQVVGPLSVSQPPAGIGIYDESIDVNYWLDAQVADAASWRVSLGTIDEARFPVIPLTLQGQHLTSLIPNIVDLDFGDRFTIANPPAWLPSDLIQQLLQGYTEYLSTFEWQLSFNASPASVVDVGRYAAATVSGANQYKYSSDGTTVRTSMTTTSTTLDLTTLTGPLWTIDAAQYPIDLIVAGERMSATSGSGTGASTQSMVVTRSVNGVVKTHAVGETVALYRPARYAL